MKPRLFKIDFVTVAGYVRTMCIEGKICNFSVNPPPNWDTIVFKQMNRKHYYENLAYLHWTDTAGAINYDDWINILQTEINENDLIMTNSYSKRLVLELAGFLSVDIV